MTEPYSNAQTTANQPDLYYRSSLTPMPIIFQSGMIPPDMINSLAPEQVTLEAIRQIIREEIDRSLHRTSFVLTTLQHIKEALQKQEDIHHDLWGTPTAQLLAWVEEAMEELA